MYNIKLINKIAPVGINVFDKNLYNVSEDTQNPCGYMVRSANLLDEVFPEGLLAIARAGAGVNNIPVDSCAEQGIVVFNTCLRGGRKLFKQQIQGFFLLF